LVFLKLIKRRKDKQEKDQNLRNIEEKMSNDDKKLYVISEVFSLFPEIALRWKETAKLPYNITSNTRRNCELPIGRNEFCRYLLGLSEVINPRLFIMPGVDIADRLMSIDYTYVKGIHIDGPEIITVGLNENCFLGNDTVKSTRTVFHCDNVSHLLSVMKDRKSQPWDYLPESFRQQDQMVVFDVLTTYRILKLRETCDDIIPNYAKVKVLEQFNNLCNLFLKKGPWFYSFYLNGNALSLGIDLYKIRKAYRNIMDRSKEIVLQITNMIYSW
jgi:hypothetical protein